MVARQAKRPTLSLMAGTWQGDPNGRHGGCGRGNMGLGVGHAAEGRSATRASLGLIGELPRVNSRASLLAQTAPIGMRALSHLPQPTQRRDLRLTSTCGRSWSARPARDVGCSCTSISRLCSPRHAGGCHERYEGTTSAGNYGGGSSCASRAAKTTWRDISGRSALSLVPQRSHNALAWAVSNILGSDIATD